MFLIAIFFAFLYNDGSSLVTDDSSLVIDDSSLVAGGSSLVTGMQSVSIQNGTGPFTPGNNLSTRFYVKAVSSAVHQCCKKYIYRQIQSFAQWNPSIWSSLDNSFGYFRF
jgi:hypothetical protein